MRFPRAAAALLAAFLLVTTIAAAQGRVEFAEPQAAYAFNQSFDFIIPFTSSVNILEGYVFYRVEGDERDWVYEGEVDDGLLQVHVDLDAQNSPRAYSTITYWFRVGSDHGDFFESQQYSLYYEDNRFAWQQVEIAPFALRWHNGDQSFAAAILAAANQGIARVQAMLPLPDPQPMTLQVYDNPADVQLVAQLAGYGWAAGHTDPAAGRVLFALAPGAQQSLEIERQVPHEVAHLMLYQGLGAAGYANLPAWLDEGIASSVEVYSDPARNQLLNVAGGSGSLLPFFSLCESFPQDETLARLAYAQSASFVQFLLRRYNHAGFATLVDAYAQSGDCLNATQTAFGADLNQLDAQWRAETFGAPSPLEAVPWAPILGAAAFAFALWALARAAGRRRG